MKNLRTLVDRFRDVAAAGSDEDKEIYIMANIELTSLENAVEETKCRLADSSMKS